MPGDKFSGEKICFIPSKFVEICGIMFSHSDWQAEGKGTLTQERYPGEGNRKVKDDSRADRRTGQSDRTNAMFVLAKETSPTGMRVFL